MNRNKIILAIVLMAFVFGGIEVMSLTMSYPIFGIIQYANESHPAGVSITLTDTRTSETIDLDTFGSSYDPVDGLFMLDMAQLSSGYEGGDGIQVDIADGAGYAATAMGTVDTGGFGTEFGSITLTSVSAECDLLGDTFPCGEVELSEVIDLINRWAADQVELSNVIDLISAWASD